MWALLRHSGVSGTYRGHVEILWWLLPAAVVTTLAALGAAYAGRGRPERADADTTMDRVGEALRRELPRRD